MSVSEPKHELLFQWPYPNVERGLPTSKYMDLADWPEGIPLPLPGETIQFEDIPGPLRVVAREHLCDSAGHTMIFSCLTVFWADALEAEQWREVRGEEFRAEMEALKQLAKEEAEEETA